MTYRPTDTIRFVTPQGRDLMGTILFKGDTWALVKVEKPAMSILVDLGTIIGRVTRI